MDITMDARALEELIQAINLAGGDALREETDKRIVKRAAEKAKPAMAQRIPRASDHSTSGRKGSRPAHGPAAANVPMTRPKKTEDGATAKVGWTLEDNSEYFYMKFVVWGTLKMPPRDFINPTAQGVEQILPQIAEDEYQETMKKVLGRFE